MEWDLKLPHWDFSELEDSVVASNGSLDHHLRGHDCSVDLKLGGLGDFGSSDKRKEQAIVSMASMPASSLSSSASKRARALRNGSYVVSCLVDGCVSDLSKCREYHRRHKVCEVHSKTPVVTVGGREQRFCQQCSRFHLLVEFDEVKRSCRKRLDGHNRRRRKPQPDFINTRSLISNHPGARFSVYPQIFPTAAPEPNWTRIIKSEEDVLYTNSLPLHLIESHQQFSNYKEGKQFPFLQDGYALIRSRESRTIASSQSNECKIYPDGVAPVLTSDCALSLLSSSSQTSGIDLSQVVPGSRIPMGQPLVSGLQYNGSSRYSCPQASSTVLPAAVFTCSGMKAYGPDICDTDLHCGCLFHLGGEGSSDGTSQALPFSWQQ